MDWTIITSTTIGGLVSIATTVVVAIIPEHKKRKEKRIKERKMAYVGRKKILHELKENLRIAIRIKSELKIDKEVYLASHDFIKINFSVTCWNEYCEYLVMCGCWEKISDVYTIIKPINDDIHLHNGEIELLIEKAEEAIKCIETEKLT